MWLVVTDEQYYPSVKCFNSLDDAQKYFTEMKTIYKGYECNVFLAEVKEEQKGEC